MMRNDWYALWREECNRVAGYTVKAEQCEKTWVNLHWGDFIEGARAQLAGLLTRPLDEGLREAIAEALILDHTLVRGRKAGQQLLGAMK